ncbi:E3 ubiquitin-protein ligase ATL31-like [Oryza brachyantha]|uniref:E3 ubiquitin-protein ligase ATL31-like n=1 Tax=Oryza brachyantha TaxID=4533 RepID=UPI001ADC6085|nr:E3 ubiquitin-protein ligase ATL31-like [Oryza brachyantha]
MPTPRHALPLALAALLLLAAAADAQPNEPRDKSNGGGGFMVPGSGGGGGMNQSPSFSAPMVVLLVALIAAFFFIGFFSIYIRRCGGGAGSTGPIIPAAALAALSRQEQRNRQRGLDPDVVESFPTMKYAEARELRDGGKDAVLECAVCLSEFDDAEELRLLPKCSHAFHPDCIGEWLAGHVTCPVCRCNLAPEDPAAAAEANVVSSEVAGEQQEVAINVDREGGEDEERQREAMELERIGSQRRAVRSRSGRPLPRSHSTGHSLAATRLDGDLERFTLRLPEHVRREMVAAAGEESMRRTAVRESRGARSARIGRSDRWPSFIARTFSSRVPFWSASRRALDTEAGADVYTGTATTPTSTTARTKRDKTTATDGSVSSAKGSVRFDCLGGGGGPSTRVVAFANDDVEDDDEKPIARQV